MQFDRYLFAFFCALCVCVWYTNLYTKSSEKSWQKKKTVRYGTRPGECHAEGALLPERLVREENAGADAERQRWTGDHGSWCNSTSGFILWYPLRNTYINRHSTWEFVSVSFRTWASDLKILSQRIFSQNLAVQLAPRQTQVTCPNCARVTSLGRTMCRSSATFLPGNLGGIVWLFGWSDVAEWVLDVLHILQKQWEYDPSMTANWLLGLRLKFT